MNLLDARAKLAAALDPMDVDDPLVLVDLVDAIEPPALMIGWGSPWLTPDTACLRVGRLRITAVASRLLPGAGIEVLEQLVGYTLQRLAADPGKWPLDDTGVEEPRVFVIAKTSYLATRINLRIPVSVT